MVENADYIPFLLVQNAVTKTPRPSVQRSADSVEDSLTRLLKELAQLAKNCRGALGRADGKGCCTSGKVVSGDDVSKRGVEGIRLVD